MKNERATNMLFADQVAKHEEQMAAAPRMGYAAHFRKPAPRKGWFRRLFGI